MATTNKSWDEDQVIASAEEAPVSTNVQTIQELYLAYYGRPADPEGLDFWVAKMEELDDLDALIAGFTTSAESADRVETGTETQRIDVMHQNLFGRNVDTAQLVEWTAKLDAGTITLGQIAHAMTQGGNATDKAIFANKMAVANSFTQSVKESGKAFTAGQIEAIRTVLVDVNADTDVAAISFADIVATFADFVEGTVGLTSGVDRLQGSSEDTVFTAVAGFSADATLNANDQVDGGAGANSLEVSMDGSFSGFSDEGYVRNVQQVFIESNGFTANSFDARNFTGVDAYHLGGEQGVSNLSNVSLTREGQLTVKAQDAISYDLSVGFFVPDTTGDTTLENPEFDIPAGTKTNLTVKFNGAGVKANQQLEIDESLVNVSVTDRALDAVTLDLAGVNVLALNADAGNKTLAVVGDGELVLRSVANATKTLDASAATGNIIADLSSANAGLASVKLGSGNDTVTLGSASVLAQLDGGAGNNTLVIGAGNAGTMKPTAVNFQTIKIDGIDSDLTLAADNVGNLERLQIATGLGQNVVAANLRVADLQVQLQGAQGSKDVTVDNRGQLTLAVEAGAEALASRATEAAADTTINAAQAAALVVNAGAYTNYTGDVVAGKAQQVTLNVTSGRNDDGVEETEFDGTIEAANAAQVTVNANGKLGSSASIKGSSKLLNANINVGQIRDAVDSFDTHALTLEADSLKSMTVNNQSNLTLSDDGTNGYTKLESLTVTAGQKFVYTDAGAGAGASENLESIKTVTLAGSRDKSAVELGTLGRDVAAKAAISSTKLTANAISVSATGLADGLSIGAISSVGSDGATTAVQTFGNVTLNLSGLRGNTTGGASTKNGIGDLTGKDITVNASGMRASTVATEVGLDIGKIQATGRVDVNVSNATSNVTLDAIGVTLDATDKGTDVSGDQSTQNVTINANGMTGDLILGTIDTAAGRTVTINAQNITGDVTLGTITVDQNASSEATGRITVNLDGTTGKVANAFTLEAKDVTVNAKGLLGGFGATVTIDATDRVIVNASEINDNTFVIIGKTITYVGGIEDDTITVTGVATASTNSTATLTGGIGDDVFIIKAGGGTNTMRAIITDFSSQDALTVGSTPAAPADFSSALSTAAAAFANFGISVSAPGTQLKAVDVAVNGGTTIDAVLYNNKVYAFDAADNAATVMVELQGVSYTNAADLT